MKTYYTNEVRFLLPSQCVDRSITAFIVPKAGSPTPPPLGESGEFSMILTRDEAPAGLPLTALVSGQLSALESALPTFFLQERRAASVDNLPAEQVEFTWVNGDSPMRQRQTHFLSGGLLVTLTGTALDADFPRHRDVLDQVVATMKINS